MKKNLYFRLVRSIIITLALTSSEINFLSAMEEKKQEQVPTLSPEDIKRNNDRLELNKRFKILDAEIKELEDKLKRGESVDQGILLLLKMEKAIVDHLLCKHLRNEDLIQSEQDRSIENPEGYIIGYPVMVSVLSWVQSMVLVQSSVLQYMNQPFQKAVQEQQPPTMPLIKASQDGILKILKRPALGIDQHATTKPMEEQKNSDKIESKQSATPTKQPEKSQCKSQTAVISATAKTYAQAAQNALHNSDKPQQKEKTVIPTKQPEKQAPQTPARKMQQIPLPQADAKPIGQAKHPKPHVQKAPAPVPCAKVTTPVQPSEPKTVPSAEEPIQEEDEVEDTSSDDDSHIASDQDDDKTAATSQPQRKKQPQRRKNKQKKAPKKHKQLQEAPNQAISPLVFWQQGIALLHQENRLYQALDLLEQALPLTLTATRNRLPIDQLAIGKEEFESVMALLKAYQDDILVKAFIIRLGYAHGLFLEKNNPALNKFIQDFLDALEHDQLAMVPLEKQASIHFIKGLVSQDPAQSLSAAKMVLENAHAPAHIRAEVRDLLKIIASPFTQQKFTEHNSIYALDRPKLSSAIEACYLLVPLMIAENDVLMAAIAYKNAAIVHISLIKEQQSGALFSIASTQAKKALEDKAFPQTQKLRAGQSRKQKGHQSFLEDKEKLGTLAALCHIEIHRNLVLEQKDTIKMIDRLKKAFLAQAEDYRCRPEIASDDTIYKDLIACAYGAIASYYCSKEPKSVVMQYLRIAHDLSPSSKGLRLHMGKTLLAIPPVSDLEEEEGHSILTSLIEEGPGRSSIGDMYGDTYNLASYFLGRYFDPASELKTKRLKKDEQLALHYYDLAAKAGHMPAIQYMVGRRTQQQIAATAAPTPRDLTVAQVSTKKSKNPFIETFTKLITATTDDSEVRDHSVIISLGIMQFGAHYENMAECFVMYVLKYQPHADETRKEFIELLTRLQKFHKEQTALLGAMPAGNEKDKQEKINKKIGICIGIIASKLAPQ